MRLVLLLALAACGGGQCPPGQLCAGPDPGGTRCSSATAELSAALENRGTCIDDSDCLLIGGQFDFPTCDCAAFAGDCSGVAIARNAPDLATARDLIEELAGCSRDCTSGEVVCACDCAP